MCSLGTIGVKGGIRPEDLTIEYINGKYKGKSKEWYNKEWMPLVHFFLDSLSDPELCDNIFFPSYIELDPIHDIVWQHGTSDVYLENIKKDGLKQGNTSYEGKLKPQMDVVYLASPLEYGNPHPIAIASALKKCSEVGGNPILITAKLNKTYKKNLVPDEDILYIPFYPDERNRIKEGLKMIEVIQDGSKTI
jgi:hypothetical protein